MLGALQGMVQNNLAMGNVVNPNLDITPDLVSQFLSEAHTQMDPEFQGKLSSEIDSINASLKNISTQFATQQGEQGQSFISNLNAERNAAGGNGTAISGVRGLSENFLQASANRSLASLASNYETSIGNTLRAGGAAVGTNAASMGLNGDINSFNLPSLFGATASLEGSRGGINTGAALNYNYNPSNYKIGTIGQDYGTALTSASNQNLSSYLKSAGNNSARTFQNINGIPTLS